MQLERTDKQLNMRKTFIRFTLLACLYFAPGKSHAQMHDKKAGGGIPDLQLSQKDNDYLNRQAKVFLDATAKKVCSNLL